MKRALPIAMVLSLASAAGPASAGPTEDQARRLFEQGAAVEKSDPSAACAKFREALALVREIGPLKKAKECDVREGKVVEARAKLDELVSRWPQQDAELDALKAERQSVDARIGRVEIVLAKGGPPETKVRIDGREVAVPLAGALELDPGKHEVLVDVPGRPLARTTLKLIDGQRTRLEVPSEPAPAVDPPPPPRAPTPVESGGLGGVGIAGIVSAAVGVAGFVGAGVTGGMVLSKKDEFDACQGSGAPAGCDASALKSEGDGLLVANAVLFGVGIAGVALGATLIVVDLATSGGDANEAALVVRPTGADLVVRF